MNLKLKGLIIASFCLLLCGIVSSLFISCNKNEEKIVPQRRTLTEAVYASAIVQPDSLYLAYSAVTGILDKNLVEEGTIVVKNQPIAQITNTTPKINTENAKLAYELAKENYEGNTAVLKKIQDEIDAAMLQYNNDSVNFFRQKKLWEQQIGAKIDYDSKKLKFQLSKNKLTLLKSSYNRTEKELETKLNQAKNNYKAALVNTKDFKIKSKINGKVYTLNKKLGELVITQQPVATIGSASNFVLEMLVDETDIVKIVNGQKVIISLDAYKEKVFDGKLSKIYPQKDERNQTFKVEAVFNNPPKVLYPGLAGEANIIINEKEDVLTIPINYLIESNKVKTKNGIIFIKTGLRNMEFVEVIYGLTEETIIYKPDE